MEPFDCIVFGGGTGNTVAQRAARAGYDTALIERGPLGGLCLNRGCNPSKMLIERADRLHTVESADRFGIDATVDDVSFGAFVREINGELADIAAEKRRSIEAQENLTLFDETATFTDDKTIALERSTELTADTIVLAAGSRPVVPDAIDGLPNAGYLTSAEAIELETPPDRLVILGGGYIGAELGYFFDAFGTDVSIIEMESTLLPREDTAVSNAFTTVARDRHDVYTDCRATAVDETGSTISVSALDANDSEITVTGNELLVALGRRANTDAVGLANTSIETTDTGFVATDDRLQTSVPGVWAMGDIADNAMFKHSGDYEGEVLFDNAFDEADRRVDFTGLAHAVFTSPQIGAVGQTEEELTDAEQPYLVGEAALSDTAMARAKKLEDGFVKVLVDPETRSILGCHCVGHSAAMLVHTLTPAVRGGIPVDTAAATPIFAHPSLSKVVLHACQDVDEL